MQKYHNLIDRLIYKVDHSKSKVPGFIVGLSGTDSIVAFDALYQSLDDRDRLYGVHYVGQGKKESWFQREIIPWMLEMYPHVRIEVRTPLPYNEDQFRWADLHVRALYEYEADREIFRALPPEETYWVAGTINCTEYTLGKYSSFANAVSIQPIRSLWKSEVIKVCETIGVPDIAIEYSRLPDCMCGRDELAASNIELIDKILRHEYDPDVPKELYRYVREEMSQNGFKSRIPYLV